MDRGGWGSRTERAQAIQIGALLLFAILIINLSLFQVFVVPNQNSQIEFKHNQQVQEELKTARSLSTQSVATDSELSTSIQLAPQYPSRALFVNPGPPSGTLETVDRGNLVLRNVQPRNNETADAWPDTKTLPDRKALVYRPGYNVYDSAPATVYGSSVLYNVYDDGRVRNRTGQTIVSGNRITLLSMGGSMGTTASGSETIEFQPTSAPTRRIPVEPDGTMQVQLETEIPESVWDDLLAGQIDEDGSDPDAYVQSLACSASNVDDPCGTLTLTFEPDTTYSLRMGRVGVGNNVQDEPEEYITKVDPTGSRVNLTEDSSRDLTVEVRDAYNNPVSGVEVTVDEEDGGGNVTTGPQRTDAEGRATFTYAAEEGETTSGETVEFEIDGGGSGPNSPKEVRYEVTVAEAGSDDPEASYEIYWKDPASTPGEQVPGTDCGSGTPCGDRLSLTMEAPGTNGAPVGFGLDDAALGTFDPNLQATSGGTASTGFLPSEATGTTTLNTYSGGAKDTLAYESFLYSGFGGGGLGDWSTFNLSGYQQPSVTNGDGNVDDVIVLDGASGGCDCVGGITTANAYDTTNTSLVVVEYSADRLDEDGFLVPDDEGPDEEENIVSLGNSDVTDPPGENLVLQYQQANGDWRTVDVVTPTDQLPTNRRIRLTAPAARQDNLRLRFVVDVDHPNDDWYVDNVKLYAIGDPGSTKGDIGEGVTPPPEIDADASNSVTSVEEGSTGMLDGSASSGSIAAYQWAISGSAPSGVSITDSDTSTPGATFDASGADVSSDTDVTVELTVTDDDGATDTDTVTVTVRDTDTGPVFDPGFAYEDVNNDGQYSAADGDFQVDVSDGTYDAASNGSSLVIPDSVGSITASGVSLKGRNVDVGVDITSNGKTTVTATAGTLSIGGQTIDSNGAGQEFSLSGDDILATGGTYTSAGKLTVTGSAATDFSDSTVRAEGSGQELKITGGGVTATNGELTSQGKVTIDTSGAIDIDQATVESRGSGQELKLTGSTVRGVGATLDSAGKLTAKAESGEVRFSDATLDVVDGSNQALTLTSNGNMYVDNARLVGDADSTFTGNRQNAGNNEVFVENAVFETGTGAAKEFDVNPGSRRGGGKPPNGVTGTPQKGTVV